MGFQYVVNRRVLTTTERSLFGELVSGVDEPTPRTRAKGEVYVEHVWVEVEIDQHWRAAYRIIPFQGTSIVAELRVFPADVYDGREPGTWRAEVLGIASRKANPARVNVSKRLAGRPVRLPAIRPLTRRFIRERVQLSEHLRQRANDEVLKLMVEQGAVEFLDLGFPDPDARRDETAHRRRKGQPDSYYAELAQEYIALVQGGSARPVADLAARRALHVSKIRDAVRTARERGLLSPGVRGVRGGQLTELGKRVLSETGRSASRRRRK